MLVVEISCTERTICKQSPTRGSVSYTSAARSLIVYPYVLAIGTGSYHFRAPPGRI